MLISKEEKQFVDSILDEQEQTWVREFAKNPVLFEAVKKVLLIPVYHNGTLKKGQKADMGRNFMLSITNRRNATDKEIGRQARAAAEAVVMLECGFSYLELYKSELAEPAKNKNNPAI